MGLVVDGPGWLLICDTAGLFDGGAAFLLPEFERGQCGRGCEFRVYPPRVRPILLFFCGSSRTTQSTTLASGDGFVTGRMFDRQVDGAFSAGDRS